MTSLDLQIQAATAEVRSLDRSLQYAYGTGDYRSIRAAQDSWQLAFNQLGRLIRQRRRAAK